MQTTRTEPDRTESTVSHSSTTGARITIPKELREDLDLDEGTEFAVVRQGGDIRLVRRLPELETLMRGGEWSEEAFRDAGEATFGGSSVE